MAKETTLRNVMKARKEYRDSVVKMAFTPYDKAVKKSLLDTKPVTEAFKEVTSPQGKAVMQQALDFMASSQRASDVRAMTHLDYIAAYASSAKFQDKMESVRADRYENGSY